MICRLAGDMHAVSEPSVKADKHGLPSAMHSWRLGMRSSIGRVLVKPVGERSDEYT